MSNFVLNRPRQMSHRRTFAVVASEFNQEYVDGLVSNFDREILALAPGAGVHHYRVPGAFELPLMVDEIAAKGGHEAIIVFGVIWEGATKHADLIGDAVIKSLLDLSLRHRLPIINQVLMIQNEEQARERCLDEKLNRGIEAARSAVRMVQALAEIHGGRA